MHWRKNKLLHSFLLGPLLALAATPDVKLIITNSVHANHLDFAAAPHFNHKERDQSGNGSKTYQITMIDGSPFKRLIEVNGEPLPQNEAAEELAKEAEAKRQRGSESSASRSNRMAKFERGRRRDAAMMGQLTEAFNFTSEGEGTLGGHQVFVLKATPKPGYVPPNRDCEVLPGMEGKLWIDQKSYQWVRVEAQVMKPVSIGGFLATVDPGTRFELEKEPVADGSVWLVSHFKMQASAKVLFLFNKNAQEEETFWDYERAN